MTCRLAKHFEACTHHSATSPCPAPHQIHSPWPPDPASPAAAAAASAQADRQHACIKTHATLPPRTVACMHACGERGVLCTAALLTLGLASEAPRCTRNTPHPKPGWESVCVCRELVHMWTDNGVCAMAKLAQAEAQLAELLVASFTGGEAWNGGSQRTASLAAMAQHMHAHTQVRTHASAHVHTRAWHACTHHTHRRAEVVDHKMCLGDHMSAGIKGMQRRIECAGISTGWNANGLNTACLSDIRTCET